MKIAKLFAVFALVLGGFVATTVSAAGWDFGTTTLRAGSTGVYVSTLQTALNTVANAGLVADGKFGAKTTTAVKAFQASKGLVADGLVGNGTKAALNAASGTSVVLPEGCVAGAAFSSTTGAPCTTTSTVPGCVAGAMYSSTTGAPCGTSTGSTGALSGGAGDIQNDKRISEFTNVEVSEGASDEVVLGREIEADNGSDIRLQNVRVTFTYQGAASNRLDRYASDVTVWLGNSEVGSARVSDLTRNSAGVYSGTIQLNSSAVIKSGAKADLKVAVSAVSNIDSADLVNANWDVTLDSIRFSDAAGAVLTYNPSIASNTESFSFEDLVSANDVRFRLVTANNNPEAQVVMASNTATTNNVVLAEGTFRAQGSDLWIDEVPVLVTATGANVDEVVARLRMKIDGNNFSEVLPANCNAGSCTVVFDDLDYTLDEGDTVNVTILADIKQFGGNFGEGDAVNAKIDIAQRNAVIVEDKNGDNLGTGGNVRTGTIIGENQTFRVTGVTATKKSESFNQTTDQGGLTITANYSMTLDVSAFGDTLYFATAANTGATASTTNVIAYVVENGSNATPATTASAAVSTTANVQGGVYRIDEGTTRSITLNVTVTAAANDYYRIQANQLQFFTDAGLTLPAGGVDVNLTPSTSYESNLQFLKFS